VIIISFQNGHLEIVKYLVECGADIHAQDNFVLRTSSRKGHLKIVKFLIASGTDIHAQDNFVLRTSSEKDT
jgi:ankyrin repeat protein